MTKLLDELAETANQQEVRLAKWIDETKVAVDANLLRFLRLHQGKVHFQIPATVLDLEPLAINAAASGAMLSGFREVMNHNRLNCHLDDVCRMGAIQFSTKELWEIIVYPHRTEISLS